MDLRAVLMGLAFVMMWSSAFATARIIVADAPPMMALAARFLISGGLAVGLARALGQSWHLTPAQARSVLIFGICQNALYLGLNFIAMQWIEASLAVIIAASLPLMVALLSWGLRGEKVAPLGIAGLILGMFGVALIMGTRVQGGADPLGVLLCLCGSAALAVATLAARGATAAGDNLLMIVGLQMLAGSAILAVVAAAVETPVVRWSPELAAAFAYQILIPGLAATLLWFTLVRRIGPTRAATFHFLNPFFGVIIAALLLGERIGALDVLGVVVTMAGILAVQISRSTNAA